MKKVLITGAAGFLGSHLSERFLKDGFSVVGMDNYITGSLKNIELLSSYQNFEFIEHDVTKHVEYKGDLDYILHFASPASPIDYLKIPIQTLKVGSLGTHNLLGLAKAKGAVILVASTVKFMVIHWFIHKLSLILEMLIQLAQGGYMMKLSDFKKP